VRDPRALARSQLTAIDTALHASLPFLETSILLALWQRTERRKGYGCRIFDGGQRPRRIVAGRKRSGALSAVRQDFKRLAESRSAKNVDSKAERRRVTVLCGGLCEQRTTVGGCS